MGKLSDSEKINIVEHYNNGLSCPEIAKKYNVSSTSIRSILKVRGIKLDSRKFHKSNQNYFDNIDTEEKAYILGFLYADGYNNEEEYYLKIELQERDKDILQKISQAIETDYILKLRKRKTTTSQNTLILKVCGKYLSNSLSKLGCIQGKSLILKFPTEEQVPTHLLRHFIRGFWDGDGHIGFRKNSIACSAISTFNFCNTLSNYIFNEIGVLSKIQKLKNNITTRITLLKYNNCKKFIEWLYKDSSIWLDRKHNLYLEIMNKR